MKGAKETGQKMKGAKKTGQKRKRIQGNFVEKLKALKQDHKKRCQNRKEKNRLRNEKFINSFHAPRYLTCDDIVDYAADVYATMEKKLEVSAAKGRNEISICMIDNPLYVGRNEDMKECPTWQEFNQWKSLLKEQITSSERKEKKNNGITEPSRRNAENIMRKFSMDVCDALVYGWETLHPDISISRPDENNRIYATWMPVLKW